MNREVIFVNIGSLFFALAIISKYFSELGSYLERSVFFIGGGAVLLLLAVFLERLRRRIIEEIKAGGN